MFTLVWVRWDLFFEGFEGTRRRLSGGEILLACIRIYWVEVGLYCVGDCNLDCLYLTKEYRYLHLLMLDKQHLEPNIFYCSHQLRLVR